MSRAGWFGRLFAIGLLVLMWLPLGVFFHGSLPPTRFVLAALALALFTGVYVGYWLLWPRTSTARMTIGIVLVLSALGLVFNSSSGVGTVNPFIYPIVVAAFALPLRAAITAVLALTGLSVVSVLLTDSVKGLSAQELLIVFGFVDFQLLLFGAGAIGLAWLLSTLRELREARETIARLAVAEERNRFARDLHDLLGHSLSLITLKGEVATQLMESRPDRAAAEVRELVGVAREALREVREAIGGYRQPTLATELAAARAALAAAGIELGVDERVGALTGPVEAVLAWTLREAVTNVARHSRARRCTILLSRDGEVIRAEVLDDGPAGPPPVPGNGLQGVKERALALGGRLDLDRPPSGGFRLLLTLPANGSLDTAREAISSAVGAPR
jgi:two-component system sensor histidine kinase DesK